jgi:drug/metabolite transporter (DMT)-like permease
VFAAFRAGEAAVVSPMNYSQILWATAFGVLFFAEVPDLPTLGGSALIIASGLYILLRERRGSGSRARPVLTTAVRLPLAPSLRRRGRQAGQ